VRSFTEEGLRELEDVLRDTRPRSWRSGTAGARVAVEIKESYRNMKYKLDEEPRAVAYADEAIRRAGLTPEQLPVRAAPTGRACPSWACRRPTSSTLDELPRQEGMGAARVDGESAETVLHLMEVWVEKTGRFAVVRDSGLGTRARAGHGWPAARRAQRAIGRQLRACPSERDRSVRRAAGTRYRTRYWLLTISSPPLAFQPRASSSGGCPRPCRVPASRPVLNPMDCAEPTMIE